MRADDAAAIGQEFDNGGAMFGGHRIYYIQVGLLRRIHSDTFEQQRLFANLEVSAQAIVGQRNFGCHRSACSGVPDQTEFVALFFNRADDADTAPKSAIPESSPGFPDSAIRPFMSLWSVFRTAS